jgi:hypothetical protein
VLKALYGKRPKHALTREVVAGADIPAGSSVLFHAPAAPAGDKPTDERIEKLLAYPRGRGEEAIKKRRAAR